MNHDERIAILGQATFSSRRCHLEPMKPYKAIRRRMNYNWDVPGPLGDGVINLAEQVEHHYQNAIRDAVYDAAVIGALRAGYKSGREQSGEAFATDTDMHRWLTEPACRADALLLLCELLEMRVPRNLLAALREQDDDDEDESATTYCQNKEMHHHENR